MPAETDWSPLLTKLGVPEVVPSADGKGTYTVSNNDAIKLALQVVQAVFPDYTQRVTPKISSDTPKDWRSIAEYILHLQDLLHLIRVRWLDDTLPPLQ